MPYPPYTPPQFGAQSFYPTSSYPIEYAGINTNQGSIIQPAAQYSENLNPYYQPPQYLPILSPLPAPNALPPQPKKQALHIPLQNYQNQGNNPYFPNPLMHNPPYSPYGNQTAYDYHQQVKNEVLNNLPTPMNGGGDIYLKNYAQNPQDQADIQQLTNQLMAASNNNPNQTQSTGAVDANGNPIPTPNNTNTTTESNSTTESNDSDNPADKTFYDPNPITRNSNLTARAAFGLNMGVDALSLMNNLVQPPPPTINIPLTHLSRLKYDTAQFDTANQQIKEDAVTSARRMREGISQAADLASSEGIINKNMAEAQRQVGMQERELQNAEMTQNNQLANQEQAGIDQARTQEMLTNWNNQSQAQQAKGDAITQNLQSIKQNITNEAQYNIAQQANLQQQKIDKENIAKQQEIDMLGLEYTMMNNYQNSPAYQKAVGENRTLQMGAAHNQVLEKLKAENLADLSSMSFQDIYNTDKMNQQAAAYSGELDALNQSIEAQNEIINSEKGTVAEDKIQAAKNKLAEEQAKLNSVKEKLQQFNNTQQAILRYKQLLPEHYNQTKADQTYDEQYRKENQIKSTSDYLSRIRKLSDRNR